MKIAYQTSVGLKRQKNEDYVDYFTNNKNVTLAIVADGIGGNRGGDVASKMAVVEIGKSFSESNLSNIKKASTWISKQIEAENQQIISVAKRNPSINKMGTTFVSAMLFKDQFLISNLGDSRAYSFHDNVLVQLTEDHSYINALLKNGEITTDEAKTSPYKNVIVRSLGISEETNLDNNRYKWHSGELILLCSDGLTDLVADDEIKSTLIKSISIEDKCNELVSLANQNGGDDNITAMIIKHETEATPNA